MRLFRELKIGHQRLMRLFRELKIGHQRLMGHFLEPRTGHHRVMGYFSEPEKAAGWARRGVPKAWKMAWRMVHPQHRPRPSFSSSSSIFFLPGVSRTTTTTTTRTMGGRSVATPGGTRRVARKRNVLRQKNPGVTRIQSSGRRPAARHAALQSHRFRCHYSSTPTLLAPWARLVISPSASRARRGIYRLRRGFWLARGRG